MEFHNKSVDEIAKHLNTDIKGGLNNNEVIHRLKLYGKNQLEHKKKKSLLIRFLAQFSDFMVIVLLVAAGVSFITSYLDGSNDFIDPIIILIIVILNAIMGLVQESKAEKAIEALKKLSSPHTRVLRNGKEYNIPSDELVVGDIMLFKSGDLICADGRLIENCSLKVQESSLTGESEAVEKEYNIICPQKATLGDRKNMVFSTSVVTSGYGKAIVVNTGMNTEVGKIAKLISEEVAPLTPLQKNLAKIGKYLGIGALLICVSIFVLGILQHIPFLEMFIISISLAVAAIPEGLPAVVTIVLAMGVKRLANHRTIVRTLPVVETLGCATIICSDKTGTLTQNKMTVTNICNYNGDISLNSPEGVFILSLAALCSNATVKKENMDFKATGDPTESAIVIACAKVGRLKNSLDNENKKIYEIPFDSIRKRMTTVHKLKNGGYRVIIKGAVDYLLPLCNYVSQGERYIPMTPQIKSKIARYTEEKSQKALRIISVCYKDISNKPDNYENIENNLIFCGLICMIDPPRPQVKSAVAECKNAGIKPIMITGDYISTAKAIAKDLNIMGDGDKAITGNQLDNVTDEQLQKDIYNYSVFARVSPEHKARIVKAFQKNGEIVAMTGDGVNDAPALKTADIGCAMGMSGTEVAKSSADMILTDDNFSTIVEAVRQGRGIFDNIRKTIHFLLSSNTGELMTVLVSFLIGLPSPLLAIQLLWVNLITDSLPALALGVEPIDSDIMNRKLNKKSNAIFTPIMIWSIAVEGLFIGAISILAYTIGRVFFDTSNNPNLPNTMAFCVLSLCQLVHAFNIRSEKSIFKIKIFSNSKLVLAFIIGFIMQISVVTIPNLSIIFKTTPLTPIQWIIVICLAFSPLVIVEIEKAIRRLLNRTI